MSIGLSKFAIRVTSVHKVEADGVEVFYRAAGDPSAPVVLLLHRFPASSFMFRELIPRLADQFRVIAPDLLGFGFTEVAKERKYTHSFDALAHTVRQIDLFEMTDAQWDDGMALKLHGARRLTVQAWDAQKPLKMGFRSTV